MDCRSFLEFLQFNKPKYDGLTQLVILIDSWLGFFICFTVYRLMPGRNFKKNRFFEENLEEG